MLFRSELALCIACNRWGHRRAARQLFAAVSRAGDGVAWYTLMAALVAFDGLAGLAASSRMAATGVVALLLYRTMKRWTRRPRPYATDCRIHPLVAPLDEFSFPSGHTLHAVAFTTVACAHYPALAALLVPFTALIAASRVVLGVHYPSDVLAATGIGLALGWVSLAIAAV